MMNPSILLKKKRNGEELTESEIKYFVENVVNKSINESQIGAMLMAIYLNDMTTTEAIALTRCMIQSGETLNWNPKWNGILADKHSTGGVGDKISIPLAPALAACGLKVPMLSGRSLDFTGGTLDKLESIPGFNVNLKVADMQRSLENAGCFIAGTTESICPADRIIYAKRNETCTIENHKLIVGSILSKKAAGGVKNLVLDIKVGRGAFMKSTDIAESLGNHLVNVSSHLGIKTKVFITRMDHPLGRKVGNSLEVEESIDVLKGVDIPHVKELVVAFGGSLLEMSGKADSFKAGKDMIENVLNNGKALECFKQMLLYQGVAKETADKLLNGNERELVFNSSKHKTKILAQETGIIQDIDALIIGNLCHKLSRNVNNNNEAVDLTVGMHLLKTVGEEIHINEPWLIVHHSNQCLSQSEILSLEESIKISKDNNTVKRNLIVKHIQLF